jgi:hypothetical protein
MEVKRKEINGVKVETYELNNSQFDNACTLAGFGGPNKDGFYSLEDATPFVNEWVNASDLDEGYKDWLKDCSDKGAEIYTYKEDWQPISEIAVFR